MRNCEYEWTRYNRKINKVKFKRRIYENQTKRWMDYFFRGKLFLPHQPSSEPSGQSTLPSQK